MNILKKIQNYISNLPSDTDTVARTRLLVVTFYYFLFFVVLTRLEGIHQFIERGGEQFVPQWPIFWAQYFDFTDAVWAVFIFATLGTLAGVIFHARRPGRVGAFIGFLFFHALFSSFGSPFHQFDLWLWIAFLLVFLPNVQKDDTENSRKNFIGVFWGAQAFLLLTYSMAGFLKIYHGIEQFIAGQASIFSIDAGALHISSWLNVMQEPMPLSNILVEYPLLSFVLFWAVIYIQFFAIVIAFRPSLHRTWAILLVLFHLGTFFSMRAVFFLHIPLVLIFLLSSPFFRKTNWRTIIAEMPLFGLVYKKYYSKI